MTVIEIIRLIGTEFKDVSDDTLDLWIEFAKPFVSKKVFGNLYERALAYFVCHKMAVSGVAVEGQEGSAVVGGTFNSGFGVSSISDGGSSISFSNPTAGNLQADIEFTSTPYGVQYLQLRHMAVVPIRVSGEEVLNGIV